MHHDSDDREYVFADDSPFVVNDSRRHRPVLPTTAVSLNLRHGILLPRNIIHERTVLDLGACIGATGYWALAMGARRYVGVEMQAGFAATATQLHASNPQARIVCGDIEDYLDGDTEEFDVVCILGLVHGLFDPLAAIRRAASRARHHICFEDFGTIGGEPSMRPSCDMRMPVAGESAGTIGFGWSIGSTAMELIMNHLGFAPDCEPYSVSSNRWLCRYTRVANCSGLSASYSNVKQSWT